MKKFSIFASLVFAAAFLGVAPAMAAGTITINTHTNASEIGQLALDAAVAGDKATASATNVVGLTAVTGAQMGQLALKSTSNVSDVIQLSGAGAGGTNPNSTASATAENVAGLIDDTVTGVVANSTLTANAVASDVLQANLAVAVADHVATSSATNFADGVILNINQ